MQEAVSQLMGLLKMSEDDISNLERETVGQFENVLYCRVRNKRITASKFYEVLNMGKRIHNKLSGTCTKT